MRLQEMRDAMREEHRHVRALRDDSYNLLGKGRLTCARGTRNAHDGDTSVLLTQDLGTGEMLRALSNSYLNSLDREEEAFVEALFRSKLATAPSIWGRGPHFVPGSHLSEQADSACHRG